MVDGKILQASCNADPHEAVDHANEIEDHAHLLPGWDLVGSLGYKDLEVQDVLRNPKTYTLNPGPLEALDVDPALKQSSPHSFSRGS